MIAAATASAFLALTPAPPLAALPAAAPGGSAGDPITLQPAPPQAAMNKGPGPLFTQPAPPRPAISRRAGRFAGAAAPTAEGALVWIADRETGAIQEFAAADVPLRLRVSRFGRIAWSAPAATPGEYEIHRADAAGRDTLLDSGTAVSPRSLVVRGGRLRWRHDGRIRSADFDGMRGDRAPIEDGRLELVPGGGEPIGPGPIAWRFGIEVQRGLPIDHAAFAQAIERILYDGRGWLGPGARISLQRVDQPPFDFRVTLAKPKTVDRLCLPLHTRSRVSCENRGRSVINWLRWSTGSPYWTDQDRYREYLISHEVGHSLGHGHRYCPRAGASAPVMQQQTGPASPCVHGSWPKRFERRRSGTP